ncbi:hypothetical protein C7S16_6593 [Burkholderia thailandensis]|uniref:Uncharacterized protein n=1 Tax=Burkholderia thailandensis TaxID=57975 RepID=A0AAW9CNN7_BURTH|nr:hypothetical protein [Burkholderia thailandensis]MDW9251977.1 hypothetical protein [Burkholderia thailandensis]
MLSYKGKTIGSAVRRRRAARPPGAASGALAQSATMHS